MENPYQAPQSLPGEAATTGGGGLARQVPVVAILLMVQGGLEVLMAVFYILFGGTFAFVAATQGPGPVGPNVPVAPQAFGWIMVAVYALMGAGAFAIAALKLFAGWRNYSFRGRVWGIAALLSGVASIVTCYCFPTAIVLMIYGLIVYLNSQSAWAFTLGDQGQPRERIRWQLQLDAN